jgi:hypothetical protein
LYSDALIVGQDEDPLALVWGTDFSRAEYSCRCDVAHALQLSEDMEQNRSACGVCPIFSCELCREDTFDVLKEDEGGSTDFDTSLDSGEEMPLVLISFALSCMREGLAVVNDGPIGDVGFVPIDSDVVNSNVVGSRSPSKFRPNTGTVIDPASL